MLNTSCSKELFRPKQIRNICVSRARHISALLCNLARKAESRRTAYIPLRPLYRSFEPLGNSQDGIHRKAKRSVLLLSRKLLDPYHQLDSHGLRRRASRNILRRLRDTAWRKRHHSGVDHSGLHVMSRLCPVPGRLFGGQIRKTLACFHPHLRRGAFLHLLRSRPQLAFHLDRRGNTKPLLALSTRVKRHVCRLLAA